MDDELLRDTVNNMGHYMRYWLPVFVSRLVASLLHVRAVSPHRCCILVPPQRIAPFYQGVVIGCFIGIFTAFGVGVAVLFVLGRRPKSCEEDDRDRDG